jgi:hypothetical protein
MKYLKLSKTSWLILAAGIFVVVMAGLGITHSQQLSEQGKLDDELTIVQASLSNLHIEELQLEMDDLQQTSEEAQLQLDEAVQLLDQTIVSVEVTDELFSIAEYCGVLIINLNTSSIVPNTYEGIGFSAISLNATLEGDTPNLINFVESLNNNFTTGLIKSVQIDVPPSDTDGISSTNIQMTIYSYKGNDDG